MNTVREIKKLNVQSSRSIQGGRRSKSAAARIGKRLYAQAFPFSNGAGRIVKIALFREIKVVMIKIVIPFLLIICNFLHGFAAPSGAPIFRSSKVKEPKSDYTFSLNIRYNDALGLCSNFTYQYNPAFWDASCFHIQTGIGSGGFNFGVGIGIATDIFGPTDIPFQPGGCGVRLEFMKTWEDSLFEGKEDLFGRRWIGLEFSWGLYGVIDIGYFISIDEGDRERLFTFGIGILF